MPFSRYQIRNEFSLADPELYKAADKDDPEALLEGVAMAGLVGVLRQLGDLAEFAAEIFHGLHEEVMVTAARGHDLLVRVQQVESDFPAIERAFLSQTGHSAFFSSSGISWHPYMQAEHNLITKGDLPRFVMDSYEECRGPPRLFLLDKFDVGGAGACLKRYTDPSFYKVEASSYEMVSVEAQRDKKIRKTKKRGPRWKNGETPEVFQPSHVKLHQLLLEERVQNGASEPARRVKLKKREIKFPFDTESGKGYMEKLLNSPPEDKLVHEVPVSSSCLRLPTNSSEEPEPETLEVGMVNSPLDLPETLDVRMVNSSLDGIEEKHISVDGKQQDNGVEDDYQSDDVASETEDYMDALATMESEVETDAEIKAANSDPIIKQETFSDSNVEKLQSRFSDSQSASDDESSSIRNKNTTFSYSDTTTTSPDNMSPHGVNSSQPFATTEIPFRPRVTQNQVSDNCIEASDNVMDQEAIFKEQTSKDSDFSEMSSNNCVNIGGPTRTEEIEIAPEEIIASTCVGVPQHDVDNEDNISNSSLVITNEEVQRFGHSVDKHDIWDEDGFLESKSDPAEVRVSYSSEDETKLKDEETLSIESESKDANAVVCDSDDDKIGDNDLTLEPESVSSETKDLIPGSNEITGLSTCEDTESEVREVESVESEKNEDNCVSTTEESCKNGLDFNESVIVLKSNRTVENDLSEESVISPENETTGSGEKKDLSEELVISPEDETIESGEKKELSEEVISPSTDSVPSTYYDHLNIQDHDSIPTSCPVTCNTVNENDVDDPSVSSKIVQDETLFIIEKTDQNGLQEDQNAQILDSAPDSPVSADAQESKSANVIDYDESKSQNQDDQSDILEATSSITSHLVSMEEKADKLETLGSQNQDDQNQDYQNDKLDAASSILNHSVSIEEKADQLETLGSQNQDDQNQDYQNDKLDAASSILNHSVSIEEKADQLETLGSQNQDDQNCKLEVASSILNHSVSLDEKTDQLETLDSRNHVDCETHVDTHSESYLVNHADHSEFQDHVEPSTADLSQLSTHINLSGFNILPELAPINLEEMPPLPPLPPMQWRMGKLQNSSLILRPDGGQHDIHHFPPVFTQIESLPTLDQNENVTNGKSKHDNEGNAGNFAEEIVPKPPLDSVECQNVTVSGTEIIRPLSTSTLPPADDEMQNGIRPMKIQRPRTPLIDAVAAHDINKLRKVSERATPLFPKEEERDTFLDQIRAQSFNLKPAVPTRPIIQGPSTNLRVAAILEKANAIRQAFAGSDDDEDDNDSWSDS